MLIRYATLIYYADNISMSLRHTMMSPDDASFFTIILLARGAVERASLLMLMPCCH